jgi:beta-ribofuranosylaminobenzene 5'-phosphate synthase
MRVTVTAYARLHLGFLNLSPDLGWTHGSLGVGLDRPRTRVSATSADDLTVTGKHAGRIRRYAEHLAAVLGRTWQARLTVEEAIPEHSGLGSGTQWALTVGTALLRLHGLETGPRELAKIMGRGLRSGIGVASFESGGFILEAGHKNLPVGQPAPPSAVILRRDFPADWRFVLVIAEAPAGLSGQAESQAFASLGETRAVTDMICRIVQLRLLPALVEGDIEAFGQAMSEVDRQTGLLFYEAQGGVYRDAAGRIVETLLEAGAYGAGQSSWGPCLYALVDEANEEKVLNAAWSFMIKTGNAGQVFVAKARNAGADILVEG